MADKRNPLTPAELATRGITLPKHPARKQAVARQMQAMLSEPGRLARDVKADPARASRAQKQAAKAAKESFDAHSFAHGAANPEQLEENLKIISRYRATHGHGLGLRVARRVTAAGASDVYAAIPRFFDPLEYWDISGMPFNMADEGHRHKLHKWMRLYYATHTIVPTLIDIFTRFPLTGMNLYHPDKALQAFYEDAFLNDSRLNYEEFFVSMGKEIFTVGEAFPLASFNSDLGIWDAEELLNPEDIVIERVPMLGAKYLKVKPPEALKRLVQTKTPAKEYKMLQQNFPELIPYLLRGQPFEISPVLLKHIGFYLTDWDDHGTPILLRALRWLMHEEKLLASQDAIAERLYSPLILAKLGIQDLGGGQGAWFPGPGALDDLRDAMDVALSSDFRLLVHHFGLDISNVFGREQMPDLSNDFDRVNQRLFMTFGVNPSLLSGGTASSPYATSALAAEFMNQMLKTYQQQLQAHYRQRALVVAEAQEHWEFERRGETRVPVMEEVLEPDDDGNFRIVQKHKLAIPELTFSVLDLRDEATERQYLMSLRMAGLPISDEALMVGMQYDFDDILDESVEEQVKKTVVTQQGKVTAYKICLASGIPIPPNLKMEVESIGASAGSAAPAPMGGAPMGGGMMPPPMIGGPMGGGIGGGNFVLPPPDADIARRLGPGPIPGGGAPAASPYPAGPRGAMPEVSMERRRGLSHFSKVTDKHYTVTREIDGITKIAQNVFNEESQTWASYGDAILTVDECEQIIRRTKEATIQIEIRRRQRSNGMSKRIAQTLSPAEREDWAEAMRKKDKVHNWDMDAPRKVYRLPKAAKKLDIFSVVPLEEEDEGPAEAERIQ